MHDSLFERVSKLLVLGWISIKMVTVSSYTLLRQQPALAFRLASESDKTMISNHATNKRFRGTAGLLLKLLLGEIAVIALILATWFWLTRSQTRFAPKFSESAFESLSVGADQHTV